MFLSRSLSLSLFVAFAIGNRKCKQFASENLLESMQQKRTTLVHWFRTDLRVHDNPGLTKVFEKCRAAPNKHDVRPIFILDPEVPKWRRVGANRWRFLHQSLVDLDASLGKLNSRLYVLRGRPVDVLAPLFTAWRVELLTFEQDVEPHAVARDTAILQLSKSTKVAVHAYCAHTIYDPDAVVRANGGTAPRSYQKFVAAVSDLPIPSPLETPLALHQQQATSARAAEHTLPSLDELVEQPSLLGPHKFLGGETEALRRMAEVLADERWVAEFEKPKTAPNSLEPSTTVLSPYLAFGCLSARLLHRRICEALQKHAGQHSKPPVSLLGQLLWREFFYAAAATEPNFNRMMGNSYCLQIPWQANEQHLDAWTHGRTGYPFIDAIMRQLRREGWIHHLARHAVACFLTRGDLWISWEDGQRVFEELLLDQDWALNAGNWMWLSASGFFHQYFRVYSPVAFGKKTDPTGAYIRKYVPELAGYPAGAIYEPWKVSPSNQTAYGCVIGRDYPDRIVIHEAVYKENIKRMTAAYRVNREVRTGKPESSPDETATSLPSTSSARQPTEPSRTNKRARKI